MKMMRKISVLASALVLAAGVQVAVAADATPATMNTMKVAVVNVQQVLQQSSRVATLSKKLESQFKARQAKITDGQKNLQAELEKFKKESPTMTQKQREDTQKKITDERSALVKQVMSYQQDLQSEQNKVMQGIVKDLNGIVSDVAKTGSYTLVLDSQAVIYSSDSTDLTTDVAKRFNSKS